MLDHLKFSLTRKVELICCQKVNKGRIIYKINDEDQYEEHLMIEPEEVNKGYIIVAVDGPQSKYINKHFLWFKTHTKNGQKAQEEVEAIRQVI